MRLQHGCRSVRRRWSAVLRGSPRNQCAEVGRGATIAATPRVGLSDEIFAVQEPRAMRIAGRCSVRVLTHLCLASLSSSRAHAQSNAAADEAELARNARRDTIMRLALERTPDLAETRARAGAAQARSQAASRLPDLEVACLTSAASGGSTWTSFPRPTNWLAMDCALATWSG